VRSIISEADCVVLPSYREGIPRTLMEAAAMAKPLIATDVPGCREVVVDRESGFLCRPQDADDLAEKMLAMIALPDIERRRLGVSSRDYVKARFDERIIIGKYSKFLSDSVGTDRLAA
jgi:glycosyltransferase involved in cell wall biosynthesis